MRQGVTGAWNGTMPHSQAARKLPRAMASMTASGGMPRWSGRMRSNTTNVAAEAAQEPHATAADHGTGARAWAVHAAVPPQGGEDAAKECAMEGGFHVFYPCNAHRARCPTSRCPSVTGQGVAAGRACIR